MEYPCKFCFLYHHDYIFLGPYTDLGGPTKKKTVEETPSVRQLSSSKHHKRNKPIHSKMSTKKVTVAQERDVNRASSKNPDKKHNGVQNDCLPSDPDEAMKLMKSTAEQVVRNLAVKTSPYSSIGSEVSSRKHKISLCDVPVINENNTPITAIEEVSAPLHASASDVLGVSPPKPSSKLPHFKLSAAKLHTEKVPTAAKGAATKISVANNSSAKVTPTTDPYAEMGVSVDRKKKKTIEHNTDSYKDVGVASSKDIIAQSGGVTIETTNNVKHFSKNDKTSKMAENNLPQKTAPDPYTDLGGILP